LLSFHIPQTNVADKVSPEKQCVSVSIAVEATEAELEFVADGRTPMMFFLGAVAGYFVAVFAASNILLPLFWAWPKARRLSREGKLVRDIPAARFLAAPLIWTAIVAVLAGIALWLSSGLGSGFVVGFMAGALQIGGLVSKPNELKRTGIVGD